MISDNLLVQQSLINNLYYLRTLGEFSINIELSFFENNKDNINIARDFRKNFEELSRRTIDLAQNRLNQNLLNSGIILTPYTLDSEILTEKLFGIDIDTTLTEQELALVASNNEEITSEIVDMITELNNEIYVVTQNFIDFVNYILDGMLKNEIFSYSYPLFYQYVILEANLYLEDLGRLINKSGVDPIYIVGFQYYYSQVLKWQAQFISGYCDPEQVSIINQARAFETEFEELMQEYNNQKITPDKILIFNEKALDVTERFRFFITSIIKRVLNAEIYFIVEPIFLDNLLTETNYFIYLLKGSNIGIPK